LPKVRVDLGLKHFGYDKQRHLWSGLHRPLYARRFGRVLRSGVGCLGVPEVSFHWIFRQYQRFNDLLGAMHARHRPKRMLLRHGFVCGLPCRHYHYRRFQCV